VVWISFDSGAGGATGGVASIPRIASGSAIAGAAGASPDK
jgi:hypothetical protein